MNDAKRNPKVTTSTKKEVFLNALESGLNISAAAKEAQVSRKTLYAWRKTDEVFDSQWVEAEGTMHEIIREQLEAAALQRAFQKSDTLLIFLLKAYYPEKFADSKTRPDLNGLASALTDAQVAARVADILQKKQTPDEPKTPPLSDSDAA